ncbi:helix-turn-helix domain-containing protein [Winogradskyella sp. A2]|uniref:helix-turn-helix domain-containing protein n=1 Tax=Winogradskyella sp. A2 TaxID=3366944 RepID=UPI00398C5F96
MAHEIQLQLPPELKSDIDYLKSEVKELKKYLEAKEPNRYLSISQLSNMLGVDKSTIHNWRKRSIIEAVQIGGRVFFERASIEKAFVKLEN